MLRPAGIEPEVDHDRLEQLARIEHRVDDPPDRRLVVEAAQQRLQQRGLAGSDLAGDDDEPGLAFEPVAQVVERLLVHAARIEIIGVRAERERTLAQLDKTVRTSNASDLGARLANAPSLPCATAVMAAARRSG